MCKKSDKKRKVTFSNYEIPEEDCKLRKSFFEMVTKGTPIPKDIDYEILTTPEEINWFVHHKIINKEDGMYKDVKREDNKYEKNN